MRLFYIILYTVYIILGPNYSLNFWTAELHVQPSHMLEEHGVLKQSFSEKKKASSSSRTKSIARQEHANFDLPWCIVIRALLVQENAGWTSWIRLRGEMTS